ncbi:hypothetical protein ACP70R_040607 [Stipagrostis hirtigluma subsp. patula]
MEMEMQMEMAMEKRDAGMEMFWGRRRPRPLLPPEEEEMDGSRSAKPKNHPLSVYEATLLKLRNGSAQTFTAPLDASKSNGGDDDGAVQNKLRADDDAAVTSL